MAESIFNGKLRYGIAVYFKPRLKEGDEICTSQEPLQVLQNDMLRAMFGHKRADKVNMEKLRKDQGMLSVNQLACYHILIETFNILKENSSPQIEEKIRPRDNTRYNMRSNGKGDLHIIDKPLKSCTGFTYMAGKLWNLLPDEIRTCEEDPFKVKIKAWIEENIPS